MKLYEIQRPRRAAWRRSSFCMSGECAEISRKGGQILMRNSRSLVPWKVVKYTPDEFRALQLAIRAGEFDDLA